MKDDMTLATYGSKGNTRLSLYASDGATLIEFDDDSGIGDWDEGAIMACGYCAVKIRELT